MDIKLDVPIHELSDDEFINTYGRLVTYAINNRFGAALGAINFNTGLDLDDLTQIGFIGLLKARDRFEPERELKFATYAIPLILGEISISLRDYSKVRVPRMVHETRNKIIRNNLENKSAKEVATLLEIDEPLAAKALQLKPGFDSLNKPLVDEGGIEFGEILPDGTDFESDLLSETILKEFFSTLTDRERQIWYLYNKEELGQAEVAELIGVAQKTVSRVLQSIYNKAEMFGKRHQLQA